MPDDTLRTNYVTFAFDDMATTQRKIGIVMKLLLFYENSYACSMFNVQSARMEKMSN